METQIKFNFRINLIAEIKNQNSIKVFNRATLYAKTLLIKK